jgi:hypothetical protein
MRIKVFHGTTTDQSTPLCPTCRWSTIVRGPRLGDEIVECAQLSRRPRIAFPVVSCSDYADRRRASLREMEEVAWVLRSDATRNKIGFVPAKDLKPKDRFVLDDDDWR